MVAAPPSAAELRRVVLATESSFVWSLERLSSRANRLQWYNHYTGDPGYARRYIERMRAVTPADVQAVAKAWLTRPRVEVISTPGGGR